MALFSRRPKKPAEQPSPSAESTVPDEQSGEGAVVDAGAASSSPAGAPEVADAPAGAAPAEAANAAPTAADEGADDASAAPSAADAETDAAASVSISVSSFGGLGVSPSSSKPASPGAAGAPAAASAPRAQTGTPGSPGPRPRVGTREWMRTAPEQTESVPGLRDNALLRAALGRIGDAPPSQALLDVARQLLQGQVFLRVKGDARALLAEGKGLPLAVVHAGDRTFAVAYSSGAALQASLKADGDAQTSAVGQPVLTVLRHVLASPYDGIIIDPASAPSRAVLPKELLQRAIDQADPQLTVKTLLAAERTPEIEGKVAEALTRVPLWVAVGQAEGGVPGLAEGRDTDGGRYLEVYSHPLEIAALGRGDNAAPITGAQLARALRAEPGLSGLVVDPAGPWIRLTRDDLAPLLALAD